MSARSSARFVGLLLAIGAVPAAGAAELGQTSSAASEVSPALSLPIFLDAARLPDMQAAWRTRFGSDITVAAPVAPVSDPEAGTIIEARETLTRAEQVTVEAAAVRERAEELSRRFAVTADGSVASAPAAAPDPIPAPVASPESPVAETASINTDAAAEAPSAQIQQVSATVGAQTSGDIAPASMLGGPRVEEAAADEAAPVIEDMATKPAKAVAKGPVAAAAARVPEQKAGPRITQPVIVEASSSQPKPDMHILMPSELRAFGWDSQP